MKILVGYDRSNVAEDAVKLAQEHAKAFGAEVHLLTSMMQRPELSREDIEKAENRLDDIQLTFKMEGIPCETHTIVSYLTAGEDIVQFAEEKKIDEIIIGVVRRSKVGKLIFGSAAQYVILNAPCSVVSVK